MHRPRLARALRAAALAFPILLPLPTAAAETPAPTPVRVATLLPYVEDALRPLPQAQVVATVRRSARLPVPEGTVDLGSAHGPSFEALVTSGAQVVVADRALHAALVPKLERTGIEVIVVDSGSVDATFEGLLVVARRVGAEPQMRQSVDEARASLGALALADTMPVLPLFGAPGTFLVITERTWIGDLLARLGFQNLAAGVTGRERVPGYADLSDETLVALRPKAVLIVAHGAPDEVRQAFLKRMDEGGPWAGLRESAGDHVYVLDTALFASNPGLGLPAAARSLVALASPKTADAR